MCFPANLRTLFRECAPACILTIYIRGMVVNLFPQWILIMVPFCSERKEEAGPPVKDFLSPLMPLHPPPLSLSLTRRPSHFALSSPSVFPLFPFRSHSSSFLRSPSLHPSFCHGFTSSINHEEYSRPP